MSGVAGKGWWKFLIYKGENVVCFIWRLGYRQWRSWWGLLIIVGSSKWWWLIWLKSAVLPSIAVALALSITVIAVAVPSHVAPSITYFAVMLPISQHCCLLLPLPTIMPTFPTFLPTLVMVHRDIKEMQGKIRLIHCIARGILNLMHLREGHVFQLQKDQARHLSVVWYPYVILECGCSVAKDLVRSTTLVEEERPVQSTVTVPHPIAWWFNHMMKRLPVKIAMAMHMQRGLVWGRRDDNDFLVANAETNDFFWKKTFDNWHIHWWSDVSVGWDNIFVKWHGFRKQIGRQWDGCSHRRVDVQWPWCISRGMCQQAYQQMQWGRQRGWCYQ